MEKSFIMIKPDGVDRGLMGDIISRIERKGFKITKAKLIIPDISTVEKHYIEHKEKPFFRELVNFITEGGVMVMEVEGEDVIKIMRLMVGDKDPKIATPGTIRGDFAHSKTKNIIHASDSLEASKRELDIWFK